MKNYRYLKGSDLLLNLRRIDIHSISAYSSTSCTGPTGFYFECETKHGYMEDPNITGTIKILDVEKKKGYYLLKVKFKKEKEEN
ncbi:MAG: hypothetical protein ABIH40_01365 [Candidatus Omnitrophota bacterium]